MSIVGELFEKWSKYKPELTKRPDFGEFWERTIAESRKVPLDSVREKYDFPIENVDVYAIKYHACDGTLIHGWYLVPKFFNAEKFPCLVHYHGFGGNCGFPADFMQYCMMGLAVVSVDCRDQSGDTGSNAHHSNGQMRSVYLRGILNKEEYYVRSVYLDCLKAVDFACEQNEVDENRIIIEGGSQGGALAVAISALDDRPVMTLADVPSNSNIEARVMGNNGSYGAVTDYLKAHPDRIEQCFETLSYFDTMNMADRINTKFIASVGGKDTVCPPEMFFATYNRMNCSKDVKIYPFNGHEGGGSLHNEAKLKFIRDNLSH